MKGDENFGMHLGSVSRVNTDEIVSLSRPRPISHLSAPSGIFQESIEGRYEDQLEYILRPSKSLGGADDRTQSKGHTGYINFSTPNAFGVTNMATTNAQWNGFFSSPQFYVVTATLIVLVAGAGMYSSLNDKIDKSRLETKGDMQVMELRSDGRLDKLDARLDKIDSRFDTLLNKMDSDGKELRSIIRDPKS